MARKKLLETEKIMAYVESYSNLHPNEKLKIPKLAEFITKESGIKYNAYLLRREREITAFIKLKNEKNGILSKSYTSVYRDIDVESFLAQNQKKKDLVKAIQERNSYYKNLSLSAYNAFSKCDEYRNKYEKILEENENYRLKNKKLISINKSLTEENKELRNILNNQVYVGFADEILGLSDSKNSSIKVNRDYIISPDKNMTEFENDIINKLLISDETDDLD